MHWVPYVDSEFRHVHLQELKRKRNESHHTLFILFPEYLFIRISFKFLQRLEKKIIYLVLQ